MYRRYGMEVIARGAELLGGEELSGAALRMTARYVGNILPRLWGKRL
jgi:hypothetical protein